jgi:2-amino-4-hydroxy-6-hydroxymethyldihydropteridine diphosphokinase
MPRIYLSLGSNIEREKNIRQALISLQQHFGELLISPVYECPAVGFSGDDFFNLVVGLSSEDSVGNIASILRQLEDDNGRVRGGDKFAARTLDIDLLTYGDSVGVIDGVELPRDEILKYAFVLKPLVDIAATELHPQTQRSYQQHWQEFNGDRSNLLPINLMRGNDSHTA